jgi:ribosome-binding ATPase
VFIYRIVGATAPQAAGEIHSDIEKGFINVEVMKADDFIAFNGESGVKSKGKASIEGKSYIIKNGDILHFRFNNPK